MTPHPTPTRCRLVVAGAAAGLVLLAGLVLTVRYTLTDPTPTGTTVSAGAGTTAGAGASAGSVTAYRSGLTPTGTGTGPGWRDQVAAAPMLAVAPAAARPQPPATQTVAPVLIPPATTLGPARVPAGYPHTPEGALGQLAAIATTVLAGMSIPAAHEVYNAWAAPGGTGPAGWAITANVAAFLGAAGLTDTGPGTRALVTARPVAALVKGTDGPDWVLACVLLHVQARVRADAQVAYGHCERMQWQPQGRWVIAPGSPPAPAPSTWPSSAIAVTAGWQPWTSPGQD